MSIRYIPSEQSSSRLVINDNNDKAKEEEVSPSKTRTQYPLQSTPKEIPSPRHDIKKSESLHSRCTLNSVKAKSSIPHSVTLPKISSQGDILCSENKKLNEFELIDKNSLKSKSQEISTNKYNEGIFKRKIKLKGTAEVADDVIKRGLTSYYDPDNNVNYSFHDSITSDELVNTISNKTFSKTTQYCFQLVAAFIVFLIAHSANSHRSDYRKGILIGIVGSFVVYTILKLVQSLLAEDDSQEYKREPLARRSTSSKTSLSTPDTEINYHQGWMNETLKYSPESYKVKKAFSTHVTLDGCTLTLKRSLTKLSNSGTQKLDDSSVIYSNKERVFQMQRVKVSLVPDGLVSKRLWSKKYPIVLTFTSDVEDDCPESSSGEILAHNTSIASRVPSTSSRSAETNQTDSQVFLFGRTDLEKEQWYRRFTFAAQDQPLPPSLESLIDNAFDDPVDFQFNEKDSIVHYSSSRSESSNTTKDRHLLNSTYAYVKYMSRSVPECLPQASHFVNPMNTPSSDINLLWLNCFLSRVTFDIFHNPCYADSLKTKLNKKFAKMHIPKFLTVLSAKELSLGSGMPSIRRCGEPRMDENGLWADIDITYNGDFNMIIETKIDIMKMNRRSIPDEDISYNDRAIYESSEEDSGESSSDEEEEEREEIIQQEDCDEQSSPSNDSCADKKENSTIMQIFNNVTNSRLFNAASEYRIVKNVIGELANTSLQLQVQINALDGIMTLNIPTAPSNRIWFGFKVNPKLLLTVTPSFGQRSVTVTWLSAFIKKKLRHQFNRHLVFPNMTDLEIKILDPVPK